MSGSIRSDLNDLFRDDAGKLSGSKIGTYAGQIIAGYLLIHHTEYIVERWDALAILLTAMMVPEMLRRFISMKFGDTSNVEQVNIPK